MSAPRLFGPTSLADRFARRCSDRAVRRPDQYGAVADIVVRQGSEADAGWAAQVLRSRWGATTIVSRGRTHDSSRLPCLVSELDGQRLGLATYRVEGHEAELVSLAVAAACRRLWLVTTNDNLDALRFYQRRGLRIVAVRRGAAAEARRLKPQVPEVGLYAIPVHGEIELELRLDGRPQG